jgi:hypothetical protein
MPPTNARQRDSVASAADQTNPVRLVFERLAKIAQQKLLDSGLRFLNVRFLGF